MNIILTTEQRDWIMGLICQAPKDNRPCDECETQYFCNILTANTAEDEGNYIVWSDGRKTPIEDEELLQYIAENIQQEASDE